MMRHRNLLQNEQSTLLIIDVQEKFRTHIANFDMMSKNICRLIAGCKILNVPIMVTEQYPNGLGNTVSEIQALLPRQHIYEKTAFSCCASQEFMAALRWSTRKQVLVCGIEAHVCVDQTVHDLLGNDYVVHIIEDAISSRELPNKDIALRKMAQSGALASSTEMALLELVGDSASPLFKSVQNLIK